MLLTSYFLQNMKTSFDLVSFSTSVQVYININTLAKDNVWSYITINLNHNKEHFWKFIFQIQNANISILSGGLEQERNETWLNPFCYWSSDHRVQDDEDNQGRQFRQGVTGWVPLPFTFAVYSRYTRFMISLFIELYVPTFDNKWLQKSSSGW